MTNNLPLWVLYIQALSVPAIAVFGALLAWQQLQTAKLQARVARAKAQHDVFERKFEVFEAAQSMLARTLGDGEFSMETQVAFHAATNRAAFLFPPEVVSYLNEVVRRAANFHATRKRINAASKAGMVEVELAERENDQISWMHSQLGELHRHFAPYMQVDQFHGHDAPPPVPEIRPVERRP